MFELGKTKMFMDPIHGYINVPTCFVTNLIDTEYFQRLRNIDQTGMRILYPSAKHDRFGHSLGVFHLGQKAVNALLENFSQDQYWKIDTDFQSTLYWAKNKILFLIACLLHDIGHAPFSHSLEDLMLKNSSVTENGKTYSLTEALKRKIQKFEHEYSKTIKISTEETSLEISAAPHEQMGAMLIFDDVFRKAISKIFRELSIQKYPYGSEEDFLYSEHYQGVKGISPILEDSTESLAEFNDDLCFIARMIMGAKYQNWHPERQIRNCFIELLNGQNFDVDKLDYIVRDTHMSGISNVSVDVERLLTSICIVTKTKYLDKSVGTGKSIEKITVTTIKNKKSKNQFVFNGKLNGRLRLKCGSLVTLERGSEIASMKSHTGDHARISYLDGATAVFSKDSILLMPPNGEKIKPETGVPGFKKQQVIPLNGAASNITFGITIENAVVKRAFRFRVDEDVEINFFGTCNICIQGEYESIGPAKFFSVTEAHGSISEMEIIGDTFKESYTKHKKPSDTGYNTFSIGFKKQAINIVANVLDARNYLYLWVYAHHKVTYYANFLIPALTQSIANQISDPELSEKASKTLSADSSENPFQSFPRWKLDYDHLRNVDDYYIWTAIRSLHNSSGREEDRILSKQLLNHKYDISMFKSLAEYDLVFEEFSLGNQKKMVSLLQKSIDTDRLCITSRDGITKGGYLEEGLLNQINQNIQQISNTTPPPFSVSRMCFVMVDYKLKQLNTQTAYIEMGNEIIPISQIPLLENQAKKNRQNSDNYFYLYYQITPESPGVSSTATPHSINAIVKKAVQQYFRENV